MNICIACLHVGQMLFAGNKYLLLKRITVQFSVGDPDPDFGASSASGSRVRDGKNPVWDLG
jgi:hypothetical protein